MSHEETRAQRAERAERATDQRAHDAGPGEGQPTYTQPASVAWLRRQRWYGPLRGTWVGQLVTDSLVRRVERDHYQPHKEFIRRRVVAGITLVIGAGILALSMATEPGNPRFYALTALLAVVWTIGAFASGPLHAGWIHRGENLQRPIVQPILLGLLAGAVFVAGALLVAQVPFLTAAVEKVLEHARAGSLPLIVLITIVNGLAEELFFRGALFAAIGVKHPVLISTVVYGLATIATLNVMLVFAALVLGLVVGLQRRVTGGVQAPMLTHITWSMSMLLVLPPLFSALT